MFSFFCSFSIKSYCPVPLILLCKFQVLTDLTADFLTRFSQRLSAEKDESLKTGTTGGFPDILERILTEFKINSVLGIRDYYENDVLGRYKSILEEAKILNQNGGVAGAGSAPMYLLNSAEEDNIPEIHFPSSEEGDVSLDHSTSQLETGLQMLQSLEQQQGSLSSQVLYGTSYKKTLHSFWRIAFRQK